MNIKIQGLRVQLKKKKYIIFLFWIILCLFLNVNSIKAQGGDLSLSINSNFEMIHHSEIQGLNNSVDSIKIQLPSTTSIINDIEFNFSGIEFAEEIIIIEENFHNTYKRVYNKNPAQHILGQAVQIRLNYPTNISGVYIFGKVNGSHPGTPQIQIKGYDAINHRPNSTLYGSTPLNISTTPGWYFQAFSSTISLNKGNYYLVLEGSSLPAYSLIEGAGFWWAYDNIDPLIPELNTSQYISAWSIGTPGSPFLYKIIQKLNLPFYPESNNMTVNIEINDYKIMNGSSVGEGYLKQTDLGYYPGTNYIDLNVFNNKSTSLIFNINYKINITNIISSSASALIEQSLNIQWTVTPIIFRYSNRESVIFSYPKTWDNISVFRDEQDISTNVTINQSERYIYIPNNTILQGAEWEVKANSPSFEFNLNTPKTSYYTGQELRFSLELPITSGNYTFILIDSTDIEVFRTIKTIPPDSNIFAYEIPSNAPDGTYIAYIFWNNETDAGVQSQEFLISLPSSNPQDNALLIIIGLIVVIGGVGGGIGAYIGVKKITKARKYKMQRLLEKCVDILNLNYLIVTDNKSGIDVYSQSFAEQKLDPSLISGFLQAVRTFGAETSIDRDSKTVKIQYKDSILLMTEFVNIRVILNMKQIPSIDFHYAVESLAYDIFKNYGKAIDEFHGNIKDFKDIKSIVEKHLNVSFIYPLKVELSEDVKLNVSEREMVDKALNFMKKYKTDHFYSLYLLPENECSPKDAETVLNLIQKGVFKPPK